MTDRRPKTAPVPAPPIRPSAAPVATLYDVARLAGVSAMTVSRVINDNPSVNAPMRERVMEAVATLKYEVNQAARAARSGMTRVGLLYSNPSAAFLSEFLIGAMGQCARHGVQLILEHCDGVRSQQVALDKLIAGGVHGILVPPPLCDSPAFLKRMAALVTPIVAIASARPAAGISAVRIDDYGAARTMMEHLFAGGHRDIAFVKGNPRHTPAQLRYQAYLDAMGEAGIRVAPRRVAEGLFTYRSGLAAARELLTGPKRPSAVFASNDDMGAAVIAVAHGLRMRVPQDLVVCGFDDTPIATTVWPELTTIRQPIGDMARAAIDIVFEQIVRRRNDLPVSARHSVLPYALVGRESTGAGG
ncbi:MAG: LacI family DNA-binding transcriptional regulator [Massilia sp.]